MIYLPDYKALFIHIPKCGGRWVRSVFSSLEIPWALSPGGADHALPYMFRGHPVKYTWAFVRQPHEWYRSLYRFQSGESMQWEAGKFHPQRRLEQEYGIDYSSFNSFVSTILDKEPAYVTRMYEWYLGPDSPDVRFCNFIGTQENLVEDMHRVLQHLNIEMSLADIRNVEKYNVATYEAVEYDPEVLERVKLLEAPVYRRFYSKQT